MSSRPLVLLLVASALVLLAAPAALVVRGASASGDVATHNEFLEVRKRVDELGANTFAVHVEYRSLAAAGALSSTTVQDTLPEQLDLVDGELIVDVAAPTIEWQSASYTARAVDVDFSLARLAVELELPPATVHFVVDGRRTHALTAAASCTARLPLPEGYVSASWLIFALTIVFPVAAAYHLLEKQKGDDKDE